SPNGRRLHPRAELRHAANSRRRYRRGPLDDAAHELDVDSRRDPIPTPEGRVISYAATKLFWRAGLRWDDRRAPALAGRLPRKRLPAERRAFGASGRLKPAPYG